MQKSPVKETLFCTRGFIGEGIDWRQGIDCRHLFPKHIDIHIHMCVWVCARHESRTYPYTHGIHGAHIPIHTCVCLWGYLYVCVVFCDAHNQWYSHTHAIHNTHIHLHTYTYTHTLTHIHIHTYTYTHTHTHIHIHTYCSTLQHTATHTHASHDTHIHIHTHTHTHTHTHIHTHTQVCDTCG